MSVSVSPSRRKSKASSAEPPEVKVQLKVEPPPAVVASMAEPATGLLRASMALSAA